MVDTQSHEKLIAVIKGALVAALYAAVTLGLAPLSFGAIQFRLSEVFNNLVVFNKHYIWALTIGCAIANLWSPMGIVDVIFGSLGTLVMTGLSYLLSKHVKSVPLKLLITVIICTVMTWSVALELYYVSKLPFWPTYFTVAIGEFGSMLIGSILMWILSKRIDLTR